VICSSREISPFLEQFRTPQGVEDHAEPCHRPLIAGLGSCCGLEARPLNRHHTPRTRLCRPLFDERPSTGPESCPHLP